MYVLIIYSYLYALQALALMAEETLYLCNFCVTVEGDWLCLRQLDDLNFRVPALTARVVTPIDDGWNLFLCSACNHVFPSSKTT